MIIGLWLLLLGFGTWFADRWIDARDAPSQAQIVSGSDGQPAVQFEADRLGHYLVAGQINGQPVDFLIDTGASEVSVPQELADRLGLTPGRPHRANTANGAIRVYATELDSVSLGPLARARVRAHINPAMAGDVALLGMSFLREFELVQRHGQLIIRAPR